MAREITIRQSLLRNQILLILLLGGALMATTFTGARRAVQELSSSMIERAASQTEDELHRFFDPASRVLRAIADWAESGYLPIEDPQALERLLTPILDQLPQISGALLADDRGRETFLVRTGDAWRVRQTRADEWPGRSRWLEAQGDGEPPLETWEELGYDPRTRPWFQQALARRGAAEPIHWTPPYVFFTRQRHGLTAALRFDPGDGHDHVVAFDVLLDDLSRYTRDLEVSPGGHVVVLSEAGELLAFPEDLWPGDEPGDWLLKLPRDLGIPLVDEANTAFQAQLRQGAAGAPVRFASGGEVWWAQARPFQLADSTLLIVVLLPNDDLMGARDQIRLWILIITLVVLAAAVANAALQSRRFSRPIEALVRGSDRISQGDLEPAKPVVTGLAEVRTLATAQERMRRSLVTLMKLERDLQLARQIQQKTFPKQLPTLAGYDLEAWSQPADETGGDSYDVIGVGADGAITGGEVEHAVLLLADATGHGIGPALSVTQIRAMLRMAVRSGEDLDALATHMNEQLCADLPGNRFITAWLGVLHARDHTLTCFSAGQAPLLHFRAASGEVEVRIADAPPFGLLPGLPKAVPSAITLERGDVYAVLSDGFYEATDSAGMELGTERIAELLRIHRAASAAEILAALRAAVEDFTGGAPLDDDRTAVIVKRSG